MFPRCSYAGMDMIRASDEELETVLHIAVTTAPHYVLRNVFERKFEAHRVVADLGQADDPADHHGVARTRVGGKPRVQPQSRQQAGPGSEGEQRTRRTPKVGVSQ